MSQVLDDNYGDNMLKSDNSDTEERNMFQPFDDDLEDNAMFKSETPNIEERSEETSDELMDDTLDDTDNLDETVPNVTDCLQIILNPESHAGDKPFICDYQGCKKAFTKQGGLSEQEVEGGGRSAVDLGNASPW